MADANNSYDQNRSKGDGNGNVIDKSSGFVTFDCPEPHCVMEFRREDRLRAHLLMGAHKTQETSHRLLDNAMLMYSESINHHDHVQVPNISADTSTGLYSQIPSNNLDEGWALHRSRTRAPFSVCQRSFMVNKTIYRPSRIYCPLCLSFRRCKFWKTTMDSFFNPKSFYQRHRSSS